MATRWKVDSTNSDSSLLLFYISSKSPSLLIPNAGLIICWFWNFAFFFPWCFFFLFFSSQTTIHFRWLCLPFLWFESVKNNRAARHCLLKTLTILICTCYNCFMYPILLNLMVSLYIQLLLALAKMKCCTVRFSVLPSSFILALPLHLHRILPKHRSNNDHVEPTASRPTSKRNMLIHPHVGSHHFMVVSALHQNLAGLRPPYIPEMNLNPFL